jgi:hypothetical protein
MRKTLRSGPQQYEILEEHDVVLAFRQAAEAAAFLRQFRKDAAKMLLLRREAEKHLGDTRRMSDDQFLDQFAQLLSSGRVRILRTQELRRTGSAPDRDGEGEGTSPPGVAPRKTSWIEIYLVDAQGKPVPRQKYTVKLPDASVQEGQLDSFGHAEYDDINPGTCEVGFPDLDGESWELVPKST